METHTERRRTKELRFLMALILLLATTTMMVSNVRLAASVPTVVYVNDDNVTGPWDGTAEHPYKNITSALAYVSSGNTLFIHNGNYTERLVIDKPLSLIGESTYGTIIDGNRTGGVIEITADNVSITGFTIRNSGFFHYTLYGLFLRGTTNCEISQNVIVNNYVGVRIVNSSLNMLSNNEISDNIEAVNITDSNNIVLTKNTLSNNIAFALRLGNSNNNTAFHNNFMGNDQSVEATSGSVNHWDDGLEGNYWSEYTGKDSDNDGIGDSSRIVYEGNEDSFPLMGTFSDSAFIHENRQYHVVVISNATISNLEFNETAKTLSFQVDTSGTSGFCRIVISRELIDRPHVVLADGARINATNLQASNSSHTFLYFTFPQNSSHFEVLTDYQYLYRFYRELYENLTQSYDQLLSEFEALTMKYAQSESAFRELNQTYVDLNQTYSALCLVYTELTLTYAQLNQSNSDLNQTYSTLVINYSQLETDYVSLQSEHSVLMEQHSALDSSYGIIKSELSGAQAAFSYTIIAAAALTSATSFLTLRYCLLAIRRGKTIEDYERELERFNHFATARNLFEADVERRRTKIGEFEQRYGVAIKPHNSIDETLESLELTTKANK